MPAPRATKKLLALTLLAYAGIVLLFEAASLDLWTQDWFFDFSASRWLVARHAFLPKLIFYNAPKAALILFGAYLLAVVAGWIAPRNWTRRESVYLLACLAAVPIAVALGKKFTGVCCPWELARYGGPHDHRSLLEAIRAGLHCQCYPAGHASGGFALLGLAFAGKNRSAALGLAAGWTMGLYQMARGAHFLSHTLGSMMIGFIVAIFLALLFGYSNSSCHRGESPLATPM